MRALRKIPHRLSLLVLLAATSQAAGCDVELPTGVVVTSVALTPESITLFTEDEYQFSVLAKLSDTTEKVLSGALWRATGGSVSPSGLYRAGSVVGAFVIVAADPSSGRSDTSDVTVLARGGPDPASSIVFQDGFESGAFNASQLGVSWTSTPWMDITTNISRTGTRAARFRQGDSGRWAELRFGGLDKLGEVFIQYYLYMPSGSEQPSVGPSVSVKVPGDEGTNNKFFRLWGDDYNGPMKVGASTFSNGDGTSSLGAEYRYNTGTALWTMGQGSEPVPPKFPFIVNTNKGKWLRIRIHTRVPTSANNDGVVQIWVDDSLAVDRTSLHNYPTNGVSNYFTDGYILGYANTGYQPGQYMYLDDLTISTGAFP